MRPGRATSEPGDGRPVRPGSTFKLVTAAAALDSGEVTPGTSFTDPGYCIEYGKPVYNYDTDSPFGRVSFFQALQYSINSVFCEVWEAARGDRDPRLWPPLRHVRANSRPGDSRR